MMEKTRYNDEELEEFKILILEKLSTAKEQHDDLKKTLRNDDNGTNDTASSMKLMEDGSETLNREETARLAARQEKFIISLESALVRIKNKTYGICRVSGKLIKKERLMVVPHATLEIDAKERTKN